MSRTKEVFEVEYRVTNALTGEKVIHSEYKRTRTAAVEFARRLEIANKLTEPTVYQCEISVGSPVNTLLKVLSKEWTPKRVKLVYGQLPLPMVAQ